VNDMTLEDIEDYFRYEEGIVFEWNLEEQQ